jgi:hypothetical protein
VDLLIPEPESNIGGLPVEPNASAMAKLCLVTTRGRSATVVTFVDRVFAGLPLTRRVGLAKLGTAAFAVGRAGDAKVRYRLQSGHAAR